MDIFLYIDFEVIEEKYLIFLMHCCFLNSNYIKLYNRRILKHSYMYVK